MTLYMKLEELEQKLLSVPHLVLSRIRSCVHPRMEGPRPALVAPVRRRRKLPVIQMLEFYVISGQELRNVRRHGRMKTYVEAFVSPGESNVFTRSVEEGGVNPVWNEKLCLQVEEKLMQQGSDAQLIFNIYAHGTFRDKFVGSVTILLADAVQEKDGNLFPITSHLVFTLDGDSQGMLNVCVPPGGRLPKRLDSLSFKKVHSDRGVQLQAFPSFKPRRDGDSDSEDDTSDQQHDDQQDDTFEQQLPRDENILGDSFRNKVDAFLDKRRAAWSWRL